MTKNGGTCWGTDWQDCRGTPEKKKETVEMSDFLLLLCCFYSSLFINVVSEKSK